MSRGWTAEDVTELKEHIGTYTLATIAKNMDRSVTALEVKMKRLGISSTKLQTGFITTGELARILHVNRRTVKCWIKNHQLSHIKKVTRSIRTFYFIDPVAFWEWAEQNKDKVQFSNIAPHALPPEPEWVGKERMKEHTYKLTKKRSYQIWTTKEDEQLLEMRKKGMIYKDIGQILNRSSVSVARRYERIRTDD
ncbi:helix-turn-helix domain-containing protein [Pseudobacillus sp. FSL P4-0506]|uniref:helix-turn-helix domain-containing protein n=1 Tax=unclassified Pseudobacillus TaxID=2619284 RepID=UPI0030F5926F